VTDIERAVRAQLVTIVQSTQTEFRAFGRVVRVRQQGRLHQVLGVYRTTMGRRWQRMGDHQGFRRRDRWMGGRLGGVCSTAPGKV